ncbi:hypothetical protein BofuT4_P039000.1 [Botrytis cinerea T4]|uniref:F-box domain-containing protein n=1 Tax=Botryotinia fuckeliana (strain T4) TaxID=999810 RepID=G2Y2V8_BOTF4|nr:hypothetical protein BofuT4_P039000.1 [Botrytis cinerea T4]
MDRFKKQLAQLQLRRKPCIHKRDALENSSFEKVPNELLQQIVRNLDSPSAALFSVSCRTIYLIIGPKYILNLTRHENFLFLNILKYDIKNMTLNGCCAVSCALQRLSPGKRTSGVLRSLQKLSVDCGKVSNASYRMNEMAASYLARDLHRFTCFFATYPGKDFPWCMERETFGHSMREGSKSGGFQEEQFSCVRKKDSTIVRQHRIIKGMCQAVVRLRVDICAHLQCYSDSMHIRPRICPTSQDRLRKMTQEYPERSWGLYWKKVQEEEREIEYCVECQTEFSIYYVHVRDCIPNQHCRMELTITTWKEIGPRLTTKTWKEHFPEPQGFVPITIPQIHSRRRRMADSFTSLAVLNLLPFV